MATWTGCFENIEGAENVATIKCLEPLFVNLVQAITALAGIGLFVMLVTGGFGLMFSGGDPKKLEQARNSITFAIIGLLVIVSGYLILRAIEVFIGPTVDLTNFKIFFAE